MDLGKRNILVPFHIFVDILFWQYTKTWWDSCNLESEIISMNKHFVFCCKCALLYLTLSPRLDFVTWCNGHLENVGWLSYAHFLSADAFHMIYIKSHFLISLPISPEKFLSVGKLSHLLWHISFLKSIFTWKLTF